MEKEEIIKFRATKSFKRMVDDHLAELGVSKRKRSEFIRLVVLSHIDQGASRAIREALLEGDQAR